MDFKQIQLFLFDNTQETVKRFRNAPTAIALESHPQPKNHAPGLLQPSPESQLKRILSYQTCTYCESHHGEEPMVLDWVVRTSSLEIYMQSGDTGLVRRAQILYRVTVYLCRF